LFAEKEVETMKTLCSSPVSFAGVYKSKPSRLQDPDPNFFYKNSTRYWVTNGPDVDNKDKDERNKRARILTISLGRLF
jgi:hypothetical protein